MTSETERMKRTQSSNSRDCQPVPKRLHVAGRSFHNLIGFPGRSNFRRPSAQNRQLLVASLPNLQIQFAIRLLHPKILFRFRGVRLHNGYGTTEIGFGGSSIPGGGPTWNALKLAGPRWADHVRFVDSPVPGHVIFAALATLPGMAEGYLQSVDRQTGQMKVGRTRLHSQAGFVFIILTSSPCRLTSNKQNQCKEKECTKILRALQSYQTWYHILLVDGSS